MKKRNIILTIATIIIIAATIFVIKGINNTTAEASEKLEKPPYMYIHYDKDMFVEGKNCFYGQLKEATIKFTYEIVSVEMYNKDELLVEQRTYTKGTFIEPECSVVFPKNEEVHKIILHGCDEYGKLLDEVVYEILYY